MVSVLSKAQHIVVMGVSGSGKSTVGKALADALGWPFLEGDTFHPQSNIDKMAQGTPLDDTDRAPWLQILTEELGKADERGENLVLSCSSLKRTYRDLLRSGAERVRFLHVHGSDALLHERMQERAGHFFPPGLLTSQLATLEPLMADEDGFVVDIAGTPEQILADARAKLQL